MPLILGANTLSAGGFAIDNSLRFNSASEDYLNKTFGTATNRKIFTFSVWVKRSILSTNDGYLIAAGTDPSTNVDELHFRSVNDTIDLLGYESSVTQFQLRTNASHRDVSAWYHIVVAYDSTQATSSNRIKIYKNGTQITSFSVATYPSLNFEPLFNSTIAHTIGRNLASGDRDFNGYMSEFNFIDGQALAPSDFGEFDSDTGIWKPIAYEGTYGTNGFYLEFKDSSALGDDTSNNSNDFTVNNLTSIDQTTDTPTNNFCTMNPLVRYTANPTFTEGNLSFTGGGGADFAGALGTIAMTQGKWFWECKILATLTNTLVGVQQVGLNLNTSEPQNITGGTTCFYNNDGGEMKTDGTATTNDYGTFSATDIMGVAINMDDKQISIYKNGSAIISNFALSASSTEVLPFFAMYSSGAIANFGNPPFAITTGNEDANGYGNFEYEVPPGYFALCTKNLAEYG
jgi:hypothetical protein